jgi:DNA-binding MurR/RpiR family transcriptional regulator
MKQNATHTTTPHRQYQADAQSDRSGAVGTRQESEKSDDVSGGWTAAGLESFEQRLHSLPLTPSQQALASIVLDSPERVAMSTIHALAADLGVNESTIARFALALELKGYAELRSACRALSGKQAGMLWRFTHAGSNGSLSDNSVGDSDAPRSRREILASQDGAAIASSFAKIDGAIWSKVVRLLSTADHVCVMGLRQSQPVAAMLTYLLGLVRSEVQELSAGSVSHIDALRSLSPSDCVVTIATQPCSNDTVKVARWAKEHQVPVVALTDEVLGPLAEFADVLLLASTDSDAVLSSMTALVSLVQALTNDVAMVDIDTTRRHLEEQEQLLKAFDVYAKKI